MNLVHILTEHALVDGRPDCIGVGLEISERSVTIKPMHNYPAVVSWTAEVSHIPVYRYPPFDEYRKRHVSWHELPLMNGTFMLNLPPLEGYESVLIRLKPETSVPIESVYLNLLRSNTVNSLCLGECSFSSQQEYFYKRPEPIESEESGQVRKFLQERGLKWSPRSALELSSQMDALVALLPQQAPSKNLTGKENFGQMIKALEHGETIQCGQVAMLFEKMLSAQSVLYRPVELYRYYPPLPEAVVNSHVVVEVYCPEEKVWALLDCSYNVYFHVGGIPANALDLRNKVRRCEWSDIKPIFNTHRLKKPTARIVLEGRRKTAWDYFCNFNVIIYRDVHVVEQSEKGEWIERFTSFIHPGEKKVGDWL
jgi:hypothetical protein